MSEHYTLNYECTNCEHKGPVEIRKGQEAPDKATCQNCGCVTAKRAKAKVVREPVELYRRRSQPGFPPQIPLMEQSPVAFNPLPCSPVVPLSVGVTNPQSEFRTYCDTTRMVAPLSRTSEN